MQFHTLFPQQKPLIGMVSLPPLPGYEGSPGMAALIEAALADLAALERAGVHAALVENDFDRPHALTVGPEVVAPMSRIVHELVDRARIPVGVQVLLNDWRASLAVALAAGAQFVRLDFFVDRVRINAGAIEPEPAAVIAYREQIGAQHIALLTDIQVKYSTLLEPEKTLEQSARQAAAAGADAIIVTGTATGHAPDATDLRAAQAAGLPVLIGSGLTAANAPELWPLVSGAIVGTALRSGSGAFDRVVEAQARELVQRCRIADDRSHMN